jgi:hypothetical protein
VLWLGPPCVLRRVLINLIADKETALRGVLWRARGPWLVLRDVELLRGNAAPLPMDGEAIVHRSNVAFIQVLL